MRSLRIGYRDIAIFVIGLSLLVSYTGIWVLPNGISNLIKPFAVAVVGIEVLSKRKLHSGLSWLILFFLFALTFSVLANGGFSLVGYLSIVISCIYCIVLQEFRYTEEEYLKFRNYIKWASIILAAAVAFFNPFISVIRSPTIFIFHTPVNKNAVPYLIAPGLFVAVQQLAEFRKWKKDKKLLHLAEILLLLYSGIYPMSRGGFACIVLPVLIWGGHFFLYQLKRARSEYAVTVLIVFAVVIFLLTHFLPEQYVGRLFDLEMYSTNQMNGRDKIMVDSFRAMRGHEIVGGGFGYLQGRLSLSYGAHNCFIDIYGIAGMIGLIPFLLFFIYPVVKTKYINTICWVVMALCAAVFESQLSYQVFVPLALGMVEWNQKLTKRG